MSKILYIKYNKNSKRGEVLKIQTNKTMQLNYDLL